MGVTVDYRCSSNRLFRLAGLMPLDRNLARAKYTFSLISLLCFVRSVLSLFVHCAWYTFLTRSVFITERSFIEHCVFAYMRLSSSVCPFFARSALIRLLCVQAFIYTCVWRSYIAIIAFTLKRNGTGTFPWPLLYDDNSVPKFRHPL